MRINDLNWTLYWIEIYLLYYDSIIEDIVPITFFWFLTEPAIGGEPYNISPSSVQLPIIEWESFCLLLLEYSAMIHNTSPFIQITDVDLYCENIIVASFSDTLVCHSSRKCRRCVNKVTWTGWTHCILSIWICFKKSGIVVVKSKQRFPRFMGNTSGSWCSGQCTMYISVLSSISCVWYIRALNCRSSASRLKYLWRELRFPPQLSRRRFQPQPRV